ncbi:hypothetical protein BDN67DRAFT_914959, partial [Paxillus ammoniavirescens]
HRHPLLQINFTTYELHCKTDAINPLTDCRDIMLLVQRHSPGCHPFCYARVLAIYHANVIYTGPESRDYQAQHFKFLWVRWFELLDHPAGWDNFALDKARFVLMKCLDTFGFIDPADVLRSCHIIPAITDGRLHPDGVAM